MSHTSRWIAGLLLAGSFGVHAQTVEEAAAVLERYTGARRAGDLDTMVSMTHPRVLASLGGPEKMSALLRTLRDAEGDAAVVREDSNEVRAYRYPEQTLFLVRTTRQVRSFPALLPQAQLYVLTTAANGGTWDIVDMSCTNTATIRKLEPRFQDENAVTDMMAN